ncbi:hypothetical protein [Streptomyces californicus]|uniref:hypothetical protein n=1 Tax=Streptomyces californicus TaxID=67351 RepID=UPI0037A57A0A
MTAAADTAATSPPVPAWGRDRPQALVTAQQPGADLRPDTGSGAGRRSRAPTAAGR